MRYVIFVIDDTSGSGHADELAAIDAFNDALRAAGHWILAVGIAGPDRATLIDDRAGRGGTSAGSLFDGPDFYSGFWLIEAPSDDVALDLARRGSRACGRRVELRPLLG
jgi:hypothetical protein